MLRISVWFMTCELIEPVVLEEVTLAKSDSEDVIGLVEDPREFVDMDAISVDVFWFVPADGDPEEPEGPIAKGEMDAAVCTDGEFKMVWLFIRYP